MNELSESTVAERRDWRAKLSEQFTWLLNSRCTLPEDERLVPCPDLKRLSDEIDEIDRSLEPAERHICVIASRRSTSPAHHQPQSPACS